MRNKPKRSNKQFLTILIITVILAVIPAILAITANQISEVRNQTLTAQK